MTLIDGDRLLDCARADLAVISRTPRWPENAVPLTLKVDGINEPITTFQAAVAVQEIDNLVLIAAPGMGKTTTLMQIAEGRVARMLRHGRTHVAAW